LSSKLIKFSGPFARLQKATIIFVTSVRQHGTRLPLNGFPLNLTSVDFSKLCHEKSVSLKSDTNNG